MPGSSASRPSRSTATTARWPSRCRPARRTTATRPTRSPPTAGRRARSSRRWSVQEPVREKLPRNRTVADVRVPGRRLQGLRHRRRVRRRPPRRDLHPGLEAGLDPGRHHGRVRHLGQLRPAVRRAAAGVRRDVHQHAVRAGGHDRRPRHPLRVEPARLHLPPPGDRVPVARRSGPSSASSRSASALQPTLPGVEETVIETVQGHDIVPDPPTRPPGRHARGQRRRPAVHAVRRPMQRAGSCYACPELRSHQRLQLKKRNTLARCGYAAVQLEVVLGDVLANLEACEAMARSAAREGAELIVLPEFFTTGVGFLPELADRRGRRPMVRRRGCCARSRRTRA